MYVCPVQSVVGLSASTSRRRGCGLEGDSDKKSVDDNSDVVLYRRRVWAASKSGWNMAVTVSCERARVCVPIKSSGGCCLDSRRGHC